MVIVVAVMSKGTRASNAATKIIAEAQMRLPAVVLPMPSLGQPH
jgi:hypothetical protein